VKNGATSSAKADSKKIRSTTEWNQNPTELLLL
jgi:hypothetical protein